MLDLNFVLLIFPVWAGAIFPTTGSGAFVVLRRSFITIWFFDISFGWGFLVVGERILVRLLLSF